MATRIKDPSNASGQTRKRAVRGTSAGREIIAGLTELAEALESGEPLENRFTVRTVEMPDDPKKYDAEAVKATRRRLGASQAVFARLLGTSVKLVQAWEIGGRQPSMMARRLMDEFNHDPHRWTSVLVQGGSRKPRVAATTAPG